jgi:hypothetical protein
MTDESTSRTITVSLAEEPLRCFAVLMPPPPVCCRSLTATYKSPRVDEDRQAARP